MTLQCLKTDTQSLGILAFGFLGPSSGKGVCLAQWHCIYFNPKIRLTKLPAKAGGNESACFKCVFIAFYRAFSVFFLNALKVPLRRLFLDQNGGLLRVFFEKK